MRVETKKMIKNIIFFLLVIILTYAFIFSKVNIKEILKALNNTNVLLIVVAFFLATNNITLEAINLKRNLKLVGYNLKFRTCFKYSVIGFFFNSITPAASGGQPMQIYAMKKDKIKISHGASALLISYITYMIMALALSTTGLIVYHEYISTITILRYLVYLGIFFNGTIALIVLIAMFSKKLSFKVMKLVLKIVKKIDPSKVEKLSEKMSYQLEEYHKSAHFIVSNKWATIKTFIISGLQAISIQSVPYFIFLALGYSGYSYIHMLLLQSVVYISVSALPLPGTVGVSETGFVIMYGLLFPSTIVDTAMLLSRGLSFYLLVIITATLIVIISIRRKIKQRK